MFTGEGELAYTARTRNQKPKRARRGRRQPALVDQIAVPGGPVIQTAHTQDHWDRMADRRDRR